MNQGVFRLLELPEELLLYLADHLYSIYDLYALMRVSRLCYRIFSSTKATFPPAFGTQDRASRTNLFLFGSARQIGDWAVKSKKNRSELYEAMSAGKQGFQSLATKVSRMGLEDVRKLHRAKQNTINPCVTKCDLDDKAIPAADPFQLEDRVCKDIETTLYNFITYCELFHLDRENTYHPTELKPLGLEIRLHFIRNCIPDGTYPTSPRKFRVHPTPRQIHDVFALADYGIIHGGVVKGVTGKAKLESPSKREYLLYLVMVSHGLETLELTIGPPTAMTHALIDNYRKQI